jgi:hypothetical protein
LVFLFYVKLKKQKAQAGSLVASFHHGQRRGCRIHRRPGADGHVTLIKMLVTAIIFTDRDACLLCVAAGA